MNEPTIMIQALWIGKKKLSKSNYAQLEVFYQDENYVKTSLEKDDQVVIRVKNGLKARLKFFFTGQPTFFIYPQQRKVGDDD